MSSRKKRSRRFDKKSAYRFSLVHRSQQDPLYDDANASKMVLMQTGGPRDLSEAINQVEEYHDDNDDSDIHEKAVDGQVDRNNAKNKSSVSDDLLSGNRDFFFKNTVPKRKTKSVNPGTLTITSETQQAALERLQNGQGTADDVFELSQDVVDDLGFPKDGYDYTKHLSTIGGGTFVGSDGTIFTKKDEEEKQDSVNKVDKMKSTSSTTTASNWTSSSAVSSDALPMGVFANIESATAAEEEMKKKVKGISLIASQEEMDADVYDILHGEWDHTVEAQDAFGEGNYEAILDDFVQTASEIPEGGDAGEFDYDAHIAKLIAQASRTGTGMIQREREEEEEEEEIYHDDVQDQQGNEKGDQFLAERSNDNFSRGPSTLTEAARSQLDREFDLLLEREYDDNMIGELDDDEFEEEDEEEEERNEQEIDSDNETDERKGGKDETREEFLIDQTSYLESILDDYIRSRKLEGGMEENRHHDLGETTKDDSPDVDDTSAEKDKVDANDKSDPVDTNDKSNRVNTNDNSDPVNTNDKSDPVSTKGSAPKLIEIGKFRGQLESANFAPSIRTFESVCRDSLNVDDKMIRRIIEKYENVAMEQDELFQELDAYLAAHRKKEKPKWDVQTIVSTYSNLDNHPTTLKYVRKSRKKNNPNIGGSKIKLSEKTGLPIMREQPEEEEEGGGGGGDSDYSGQNDFEEERNENLSDDEESFMSLGPVNRGMSRKGETKAERKARKALLKKERRARREQKKSKKSMFKDEYKKQKSESAKGNAGGNVSGQSVFRY